MRWLLDRVEVFDGVNDRVYTSFPLNTNRAASTAPSPGRRAGMDDCLVCRRVLLA